MKIRRVSLLEGARSVRGHVVIVDVYRAFTTAAFCIAAGASEIVLVETPEQAFALKAADPGVFLTGEVRGEPIPGFDAGNSPSAIEGIDLSGRRVVQRTSAGTQGVCAAVNADTILLGSFVIAGGTARYLSARAAEVTIVAMGEKAAYSTNEDEACAAYLEALLRGEPVEPPGFIEPIWLGERGWPWWFPRRDAELACQVDRFDFALPVAREDGLLVARPARA